MENFKKLAVVIASRKTPDEKKDFIDAIKETCGYGCNIVFNINQNETPLTSIYNKALNEVDADYFIFIHDDIEFLRKGWGAEIVRLFNQYQDYGIIGVAGSGEFDSDAAWWRYKDIYGQVLHRHDGKSWLTTFSPLLPCDLMNVCTVDGLFIAVAKDRITSRFNETFKFDHYDTSFCLQNFIDGKTKIGVTTNIRLAHNSIGQMRDDWYISKNKLNEIFNNYYPIKAKHDVKINR